MLNSHQNRKWKSVASMLKQNKIANNCSNHTLWKRAWWCCCNRKTRWILSWLPSSLTWTIPCRFLPLDFQAFNFNVVIPTWRLSRYFLEICICKSGSSFFQSLQWAWYKATVGAGVCLKSFDSWIIENRIYIS